MDDKLKVLLIEDNPGDARLIKEMLAEAGEATFELEQVNRLSDGLERLTQNGFGLILLDLSLPDSRGLDTFIMTHSVAAQVPIILLTGLDDKELALKAMRQGAQDYLVKGQVDSHLLVRAMRYAIERKRVEEALRESQSRYRTLFDSASDMILISDLNGQLLEVNQVACERLNYTHKALLHMNLTDLDTPEHAALTPVRINQVQQQGHLFFETVQVRQDGKTIPIEMNARLIEYEGQAAILSIARDITERKRAEEALRASEERYRTLFNSAPVGLFHSQPDGTILDANQALIEMLGYPDQATLLSTNAQEMYVNLEDRQKWMARVKLEGIVKSFSVKLLRHDGSKIWASMNTQAIYDPSGKVLYYEGSLEDVTKRREAQQALEQYTKELRARNEELDAFADTVAHDLKGPLGLMLGFAELLQMDHENKTSEQNEHIIQQIIKAGRKMHSIIKELLLLARLRQQEVEMNTLDMAEIISEAQQRLTHMIKSAEAHITYPDTWPSAVGYAPWVEEIWMNYLSNALKYSGQPPRIEIGGTAQADGQARFWVRDNGPGLTPEEQSQLFKPFTRLNQARAKGHGLGLSIVRRIAEKLGGTVGVESQVGEGSTFWFTLRHPSQALTGPHHPPAEQRRASEDNDSKPTSEQANT